MKLWNVWKNGNVIGQVCEETEALVADETLWNECFNRNYIPKVRKLVKRELCERPKS